MRGDIIRHKLIYAVLSVWLTVLFIFLCTSNQDIAETHIIDDYSSKTDVPYESRQSVIDEEPTIPLLKPNKSEEHDRTSADNTFEEQTTTIQVHTTTTYIIEDSEYTYATQIWNYLRNDMGLNKYVAAGILGNIMTECGGQTLNIQPFITNNSGHYGICQWNLRYFPEVKGRDLHGQLEFLNSTMRWILNDYGDRYYEGFNYNLFVNITDEQVAAEAFAYAYEGCGAGNCSQRRLIHATTALNYFEGD